MKARSKETISYTMSRIRGKNTGIEKTLRHVLYEKGLHYRCNTSFIYGHPDISFKAYKVVVFCDSEFWHGYHFEENKAKLHSNTAYWIKKIERNIARDQEVNAELTKEGYTILRYWGQEILQDPEKCADEVVAVLKKKGYPGL
jgi:DNA mismatch endonuclease (patch repair protein)